MPPESLSGEKGRVKAFEGRWSVSRERSRLSGLWDMLKGGPFLWQELFCYSHFGRLDIPSLCGEADVDWLVFLP